MKMNDLILREMRSVGADERVLTRLLPYGKTPLISWVLHRIRPKDCSGITTWLELVSANLDYEYEYHQLKYAYFSVAPTPLVELERDRGYKAVCDLMVSEFGTSDFWATALPYLYRPAKRLAAEIMFSRGEKPVDVAIKLDISDRLAYYIRKAYTEEFLNEKESDLERVGS